MAGASGPTLLFRLNRPSVRRERSDDEDSPRLMYQVDRLPLCQNVDPNGLASPSAAFVVCAMWRLPTPMRRTARKYAPATSAASGGPSDANATESQTR